ncbi:hypothetical protein SARC_00380 [Sphaeroforma arctica JP610]|uniref:Uncharacterized protein n=1 Tax=Sphaeroforma arctica JP610 TaxID=667725 RepID=A0A0L0GF46_9EUKA|nr:hypothetical protein SARC_00380 [Sphaeroforma arctica JP610]KNC87494.1 hypothetical protein SARC_00380 [Sphaeroforma arctica JP610]|eukprot:XP_014161396.1 hypothetical protein SARC_00380 [Sphaeroforma arctica JP610]
MSAISSTGLLVTSKPEHRLHYFADACQIGLGSALFERIPRPDDKPTAFPPNWKQPHTRKTIDAYEGRRTAKQTQPTVAQLSPHKKRHVDSSVYLAYRGMLLRKTIDAYIQVEKDAELQYLQSVEINENMLLLSQSDRQLTEAIAFSKEITARTPHKPSY